MGDSREARFSIVHARDFYALIPGILVFGKVLPCKILGHAAFSQSACGVITIIAFALVAPVRTFARSFEAVGHCLRDRLAREDNVAGGFCLVFGRRERGRCSSWRIGEACRGWVHMLRGVARWHCWICGSRVRSQRLRGFWSSPMVGCLHCLCYSRCKANGQHSEDNCAHCLWVF